MTTSKKELPFLTTYMTLLFVLLGSDWILPLIGFEYNIWSDPFDIIKFIIKLMTIYLFYFIGIKFFSWLYSASPQKTKE
ncbi:MULTISPECIES: hypothetical protein [unclassified Pseudoalteromonas]|uniref:hypothetical protein n=1 Tax=unclassified Pseudoalteromonas TaxID=194690 RepID=UPI0013FD442D|nr:MULTISPECIES: hypothetical protein [unclassified Pseudoalteromonas]MBH0012691.1 hypothetical protein [Pseudoalteromonas sp. NZS100_1]MBH0044439.1 hypothetical protein [Pseudoalteromonas sp. SWXJZ10B]MBH0076523.1 hypothetical protein [Pseudoalteromonas sp. SWYJ118]